MSAVDESSRSWLNSVATTQQDGLQGWGSQGVYLLIVGIFIWGVGLGVYRRMYCG